MSKVPLTCPQCGDHFEYEYVAGASLSAVRMGWKRYMKCPVCGKWGTFDLRADRQPAGALPPQTLPTYSDTRLLKHRGLWIVVPVAVILISLVWVTNYPLEVVTVDVIMAVLVVVLTIVVFTTSRLPRTR
ncbi:MAG: hypothetical protein ABSA15_05510 [Thermoplasmata archaeon]|jgi:hypothetical protein